MLTAKQAAEKRKIDAKVFAGTATRREMLRGLDLKRKQNFTRPSNRVDERSAYERAVDEAAMEAADYDAAADWYGTAR